MLYFECRIKKKVIDDTGEKSESVCASDRGQKEREKDTYTHGRTHGHTVREVLLLLLFQHFFIIHNEQRVARDKMSCLYVSIKCGYELCAHLQRIQIQYNAIANDC